MTELLSLLTKIIKKHRDKNISFIQTLEPLNISYSSINHNGKDYKSNIEAVKKENISKMRIIGEEAFLHFLLTIEKTLSFDLEGHFLSDISKDFLNKEISFKRIARRISF